MRDWQTPPSKEYTQINYPISTLVSKPTLQIKFDANQDYQIDAVRAVVDLFDGLGRDDRTFTLAGDEIVGNLIRELTLDHSWLLSNLQDVQDCYHVDRTPSLSIDASQELEGVSNDTWEYPSFTVEMETGTGKTYVYLRTILELRKTYGFRKFVIVVPSVAIYEGVAKTFEITRAHFASLYGNEPIRLIRYDGQQLSNLREYATSSFCEVLLITLDSFNKSTNVIYRPSEKLPGERLPHQFIQETRPVLLLDEPQNMESPLARSALATLHPLFALRYSATHRSSPNLVYRLTPFEAFRRNLVKRIQVFGVTEIEDANRPSLRVNSIAREGGLRTRVTTYVYEAGRAREKEFTLKDGDDLYAKTARDEYKAGYVVSEINLGEKWVEFENGLRVREGEDLGYSKPAVFRTQIRETVQRHMETQTRLRDKGIKVLSLFFIDRVASYTDEDGLVRTIFDEEFIRLRRGFSGFEGLEPEDVREAYFASKKKTRAGEFEAVDIALEENNQRKEDREAAKRAFELIMRDKERLLSFEETKSFIFAHSALKEGWDNPNVFQICTLNQTTSELKKRQEIGRGLRLCVNQRGERVLSDEINVLTVVANQSYQSYAEQLQQEYRDEGQEGQAPPPPSNAKRDTARRNDKLFKKNANFIELWQRLSKRLRYNIRIDTEELVRRAALRLNGAMFPTPKLVVQRGDYIIHHYRIGLIGTSRGFAKVEVKMENTAGREWDSTRTYAERENFEQVHNDERLRGFKLLTIIEGKNASVSFDNGVKLMVGEAYEFSSAAGQKVLNQATFKPDMKHRVFNVIERAKRETNLTRVTLNRIFRELTPTVQRKLFTNPEGWAGEFVMQIREALTDLASDSISFTIDGVSALDLEELFPPTKQFTQKELIDGGVNSLYDRVQRDSDVEERFVARLRDDPCIELYFKFPPSFRIGLPRIVGNYNPDWGIVRRDDEGKLTLHLVRETKGSDDIKTLRFSHEKRKIVCAKKYFETAQVDFRVITDRTPDWWKTVESVEEQLDINLDVDPMRNP